MDIFSIFGPNGLAFAFIIAAITQVAKEMTGWQGKRVRVLSLLVGLALGVGLGFLGLRTEAGSLFPGVPAPAGGAILGSLLGLVASGGYSMITWLQDRGVRQRVQAEEGLRSSQPAPAVQMQVEAPAVAAPAPQADPSAAPAALGAEIEPLPIGGLTVHDIPARPLGFAALDLAPDEPEAPPLTHPAYTLRD